MAEETQNEVAKPKYRIIDNALEEADFIKLKTLMTSTAVNWKYIEKIQTPEWQSKEGYFLHTFFNDFATQSPHFGAIAPILRILKPQALIKIKANLYTRWKNDSQTPTFHGWHKDKPYPHQSAIFYINTNDGFTVLDNGTKEGIKIASVANRLLIFEGHKNHSSTDCTDQMVRMNIAFSFFNTEIDDLDAWWKQRYSFETYIKTFERYNK